MNLLRNFQEIRNKTEIFHNDFNPCELYITKLNNIDNRKLYEYII